jgi:hypothetical protein
MHIVLMPGLLQLRRVASTHVHCIALCWLECQELPCELHTCQLQVQLATFSLCGVLCVHLVDGVRCVVQYHGVA